MLKYDVMPDLACIPIGGTSLQGRIEISYYELVQILGEPTSCEPSADDKVRAEWVIEFYDEIADDYAIATIYDWKEDKPIEWVTDWHIGGFKSNANGFVYEMVKEYYAEKT